MLELFYGHDLLGYVGRFLPVVDKKGKFQGFLVALV